MELIAAITTSANGFWEPGWEGRPAPHPVTASHRIRFARADVTALTAIPQYSLPSIGQLLETRFSTGLGGHAWLGHRRGADGQWVYDGEVLKEFDDCTGVMLNVYVIQGWISGTAMVFRRRGILTSDEVRLVTVKLVFDARTGLIVHTLADSATKDAEPDRDDLDEQALREAREHAPADMQLRVRTYERLLLPGRVYRVDPETGAVIEIRA